jgi:hypothetical protein
VLKTVFSRGTDFDERVAGMQGLGSFRATCSPTDELRQEGTFSRALVQSRNFAANTSYRLNLTNKEQLMPKQRKPANALDEKFEALASETGVTLKPVKVTAAKGKFRVKLGAAQKELVVGEINTAADVKKLVGKNAVAAVSGKSIAAIGARLPGCYWILCYIPAPDIFQRIRPELRTQLIQKFVQERVISEGFAEELQQNLGPR